MILYRKGNIMHYLGLDISKLTIDAVLKEGNSYKHIKIDNNQNGFDLLYFWLKKHQLENLHICMEATGSYYEEIALYFSNIYLVSVCNPLKIKRYAESVFSRTKNDKQDAKLIADYCETFKPEKWNKPSNESFRLNKLLSLKNQLISLRTAEKNRIQNIKDDFIFRVHQSNIDYFNHQIKEIEAEIEYQINSDELLKQKNKNLQTIKGIGKNASSNILSKLETKHFKTSKQYIAYLGLCPSEKSSGTSVRGKGSISKLGHRQSRSAYFMPALVAYRYRIFPDFISRLESKGKPKKVIIVAIMKKLATIAFHVHKSGLAYQSERYSS